MHDKSYAANVVKHCVRPCDMSGKSAAMILRKINDEAYEEAVQHYYDQTVSWISKLRLDEATEQDPYSQRSRHFNLRS